MAFHDFWMNVRRAANSVAPEAIIDAPQLDTEAIERTLRGETHWVTPRAVAGFDEHDLLFLPDSERSRLTNLVQEFLAAVSSVSRTRPAPDETVQRALPYFRDIVQLLEFGRYEDAEAFRLGKQIEQAIKDDWPTELAELRFRTKLDHTGDPGLWIWGFLSAEASESDERFLANLPKLRDLLDTVAREVSPDRFPYLSFRSLAEESEPVEAP